MPAGLYGPTLLIPVPVLGFVVLPPGVSLSTPRAACKGVYRRKNYEYPMGREAEQLVMASLSENPFRLYRDVTLYPPNGLYSV